MTLQPSTTTLQMTKKIHGGNKKVKRTSRRKSETFLVKMADPSPGAMKPWRCRAIGHTLNSVLEPISTWLYQACGADDAHVQTSYACRGLRL